MAVFVHQRFMEERNQVVGLPTKFKQGFVEMRNDLGQGGLGWEFGEVLWSPTRSASGSRIYELMKKPRRGDLVIHFFDESLAGFSRVSEPCEETEEEPPNYGPWSGRSSYYRVEVEGFESFPNPVTSKEILTNFEEEIRFELQPNGRRFYPFAISRGGLRRNQGMYLSELTPTLYNVFRTALGFSEATGLALEAGEGSVAYAEEKRRMRERSYFARNPKLVADAKAKYGYVCQACGFDFEAKYGSLGRHYIECHHLNPLSERPDVEEPQLTSLDEVAMVCSNCHRMIHQRRPALSLEELRESLK